MSVLELKDVTKSFGGVRALEHLSLGFDQGKITALIGPNGAGKTTLFNIISGFLRPDGGTIHYKDTNLTKLPPWCIALEGIGRLFQDVRVFNRMRVKDNIMTAFKRQKGENPLLSIIARSKVSEQEYKFASRVMEFLAFVNLADKADELAENLSYGQQKLLAIARLLAADAEVLLLDEPTAGVSPQVVGSILEVIRNLASEGKVVVVIEHNMNVVIEIADWVYFIDEGQVISFGLPGEVLEDPEIRAAYIGL